MATTRQLIDEVNRYTVSELRVSYYPKMKPTDRASITGSGHAYQLFLDRWNMDTIYMIESAYLLLMNRANRVLGIIPLSVGGPCGTVVDPRIVLKYALVGGATSIMIAHNHPSGNLQPSNNDRVLTAKLKEAASFHDILLMDHLIVMPEGYLSMADEGYI